MKKFLVNIEFKDWVNLRGLQNTVIEFYIVDAANKINARLKAFDNFEFDYNGGQPWMKKFMSQFNATLSDTCAPDAVEIANV